MARLLESQKTQIKDLWEELMSADKSIEYSFIYISNVLDLDYCKVVDYITKTFFEKE